MKVAIFIFILLANNYAYACDNSQSTECSDVQIELNELSNTKTNDCCSELCYCSCCTQVSVINLTMVHDYCENYSTPIIYNSIRNLSDYFSFHWQPPKV